MRPTDPRLRRRLAPARRPLIVLVAAGVLAGVLVVAQAWTVTQLLLAVLRGQALVAPAAAVVGTFVARALVGAVTDHAAARAASLVGTGLRRAVVRAGVLDARPSSASTGARAVLATRGVSAAEPYLTRYLPALVLAAVLPALTVVVIATQDLLSALIVVLTLPLVPLFGALVGLATRDRAERQWRELASLSGHFLDVVRGLPTLVLHRRARAQSARIGAITERYRLASLDTLRIAFASSAVLELVATLSVALVAVTMGVRLAGGSVGLETALLVLLLAPEAYWPLRRVGAEFHAAAEGVATFEAVDTLLADAGDPSPVAERVVGGATTTGPRSGGLVLTGVGVTYPGRLEPALAPLHATIPATGVTVLTGPSGCGKSTLLAVLAGVLRPSTGTAYVGAVPVGAVPVGAVPVGGTDWQAQVAWLPQRPHFVAGSVADNLRLGRPDASEDELWRVLCEVALAERVRDLPHGLATSVGEDGTTLSAGERARLALARVVLADRPWSLLDEPTAHLDDLTARVIADTVAALGRRGAVVMVAHDPAATGIADRVITLPTPPASPGPPVAATPGPRPVAVPTPGRDPRGPTDRSAYDGPAATAPQTAHRARGGFALATGLGTLASASGVALTATAGWLIVQASTQPPILTLLLAIVGVRAFGLARPVLRYAERLLSHDAALRLLARRRVEVYDALVPLTPARLGRRRGDVLSAVVEDVDGVVDQQLRVLMPLRVQALVALVATAVATVLLWPAGVVVALCCATAGPGAYLVARHGARRAETQAVALRAELSTQVVECLQVAPELVMWQATDRAVEAVARTSDRIGRVTRTAAAWLAAARGLTLLVCGAAVAATAVVTEVALDTGTVSAPTAALLVLLPLALLEVLSPVADAGAVAARTEAAAARLHRLEHTAPAVRDTVPRAARVTAPTVHPSAHPSVTGVRDPDLLEVSNVRARWEPSAPLTAELSMRLQPGERVVVTGPSGSGKSTLAAMLVRFLDPTTGQVALDGTSLRDLALDDVRRRTGLVDDDPHVFATTLVENVRLARPGAAEEEVERALRAAHLGAWLDALPDGLHTWLGDGHAQVSGGERARLALARSLLADQPVLVLDEPTAHLDHATALALAAEILTGPRSRSVVWITHDRVGHDLADRVVDLGPAAPGGQ